MSEMNESERDSSTRASSVGMTMAVLLQHRFDPSHARAHRLLFRNSKTSENASVFHMRTAANLLAECYRIFMSRRRHTRVADGINFYFIAVFILKQTNGAQRFGFR